MTIALAFFVAAIVCFVGVAIFATSMTGNQEIIRWVAAGLALFAAGHIAWPARGPRQ